MSRPLSICLFGAAGDTGNLGVSALLAGTLVAVARRAPGTRVTAFDNGWGVREAEEVAGGERFAYRLCGSRLSRRIWRPESFWNMRLAGRLGGLGNPGIRAIRAADAVWDASGGDSFCDLYGPKVLRAVVAPKRLALEHGVPLVFLPQTYGPFASPDAREEAVGILRRSALAWARDERSFAALRELLGPAFDPERHRLGVDVAFRLEAREPAGGAGAVAPWLGAWLDPARARPTVGLNVSGLVHNDPGAARRYGLRADYRRVVLELSRELLSRSEANLLLVPHVLAPPGAVESDPTACEALRERLGPGAAERVRVLPPVLDAAGTKWVVSRLDWFCGTRMHSCIAALSSGVPAASIAYSLKTQGVFECCGAGDAVVDLRSATDEECVAGAWRAWEERERLAGVLAAHLPDVLRRADAQIELTLERSAVPAAGSRGRAAVKRISPGR